MTRPIPHTRWRPPSAGAARPQEAPGPMVTTGAPRMKITYATLSADNEELQAAFDRALEAARAQLGERYPMLIGDERRFADKEFEDRSPIDSSLELLVGKSSLVPDQHRVALESCALAAS